jgi:hypothetical protein
MHMCVLILQFKLRALRLLGGCSTTLAMHLAFFKWGLHFCQASLDLDPPVYASYKAGARYTSPCPAYGLR